MGRVLIEIDLPTARVGRIEIGPYDDGVQWLQDRKMRMGEDQTLRQFLDEVAAEAAMRIHEASEM